MHECASVSRTPWCGAIRGVKKTNEEGRVFLSAEKQPYAFQRPEKVEK